MIHAKGVTPLETGTVRELRDVLTTLIDQGHGDDKVVTEVDINGGVYVGARALNVRLNVGYSVTISADHTGREAKAWNVANERAARILQLESVLRDVKRWFESDPDLMVRIINALK